MTRELTLVGAQRMVAEFHDRLRVSEPEDPERWTHDPELEAIAREGLALSERLMKIMGDSRRRLRGHLELEETCEFLLAMALAHPAEALDAKADQLYVLLGSVETLGLPLEAAFTEVHASNMTKEKQPEDPHADRVRQKGPNYRPPRTYELYVLHARKRGSIDRGTAAQRLGLTVDQMRRVEYAEAFSADPLGALAGVRSAGTSRSTSVVPPAPASTPTTKRVLTSHGQ